VHIATDRHNTALAYDPSRRNKSNSLQLLLRKAPDMRKYTAFHCAMTRASLDGCYTMNGLYRLRGVCVYTRKSAGSRSRWNRELFTSVFLITALPSLLLITTNTYKYTTCLILINHSQVSSEQVFCLWLSSLNVRSTVSIDSVL